MVYGIVQWWLQRNTYSSAEFDIGNTFDETEINSVRNLYDKIMDDAVNTAKTDASASALQDLRNQGNFRNVSTSQVASSAINQIQEAFKQKIRDLTETTLIEYDVTSTTKNKVRREIVSDFEIIKISDIPDEVEDNLFTIIKSELEDPIIQQASKNVTGSELTKQELFELWHINRSMWSLIKAEEKIILHS